MSSPQEDAVFPVRKAPYVIFAGQFRSHLFNLASVAYVLIDDVAAGAGVAAKLIGLPHFQRFIRCVFSECRDEVFGWMRAGKFAHGVYFSLRGPWMVDLAVPTGVLFLCR